MNINHGAPVRSERELLIEATSSVVWKHLTSIDSWPRWNRGVSQAQLDGPFAPGSVFRWRTGGSSLVSTIQEVKEPTSIAWTGKTFGITAVHVWELRATGPNVLVTTSESFDGWLVRLLRPIFQRILDKSLEQMLVSLKRVAETPAETR